MAQNKLGIVVVRKILFFLIIISISITSNNDDICLFFVNGNAAATETLVGIVGKDFIMLGADSSVSQSISLTSSNLDKMAVIVDPFPGGRQQEERQRQQQTIVVAAAGDSADADRLVTLLTAHAAITEYEASVGCDVDFVPLNDDDNSRLMTKAAAFTPPGLTVRDIAYYARGCISQALRSRSPYRVNLLVAGMMYNNNNHRNDMDDEGNNNNGSKRLSFVSEEVQKQIQLATTNGAVVTGSPKEEESQQEKSSLLLKPFLFWLDEYGSLIQCNGGKNSHGGGGYGAHGYGSNFLLSILDQNYSNDISRKEAIQLIQNCFDQLRTRYVINSPQPPCIKCIDSNGCQLIL